MDLDIAFILNDIQRFLYFIRVYVEREFRAVANVVTGGDLLVHYTASRPMTEKYLELWKGVEKDTGLQYYSYNDCLLMIRDQFNPNVLQMFENVHPGWKKVLLFKLITMYMKTGIVIDPNVIPKVSPDMLKREGIHTYITVSETNSQLNMMMMASTSSRRSLLFLTLLLAYLIADKEHFDLYSILAYNIGTFRLKSDETYELKEVKYRVVVGCSKKAEKDVDLIWFPYDEIYDIRPCGVSDMERFRFYICDNRLHTISKDGKGWQHSLSVDITFMAYEVLYTLSEEITNTEYRVKKDELVLLYHDLLD